MNPPSIRRIGITGGIGSGKSLAVKFFNELGIPSVDADALARKLREPGQPAHATILKRFGTDDRKELRKLLSTDPQAKHDLESILHPLIERESENEFRKMAAHTKAPFMLYEASLLIEAGRAKDFDSLIVVTAPEKTRVARIVERDQISESEALAMIRAQMPESERLKQATQVLDNSGTPDELKKAVIKLLDQFKQA